MLVSPPSAVSLSFLEKLLCVDPSPHHSKLHGSGVLSVYPYCEYMAHIHIMKRIAGQTSCYKTVAFLLGRLSEFLTSLILSAHARASVSKNILVGCHCPLLLSQASHTWGLVSDL